MKKRLFQYAVLFHETELIDNKESYKDSRVIIEPTFLLAKDEKEVVFKVTRLIPEEEAQKPDNVEIVVRNF